MSGNVESTEGAEISAGMEVRINRRNFPINLWHLVNDPQICSICWDDSGEGILICPEAFKAEVLSADNKQMIKYFRTTNFINFVRQLNLYGFRKVCPDYKLSLTDVCFIQHYFNPNFKRANPELLAKLKRLTPSNRAKLATEQDVSNHPSTFHPVLNSPDISAVVENHCCIPGSLDSNMPSQQEAASSAHCGYYPDSFSHLQYTGQDPNCESDDVQDDSFSHLQYTGQDQNLESDDVQDDLFGHLQYTGQDPNCESDDVQYDLFSHLQYTGQDPNLRSDDVQDDLFSHLLYTGQDPDPRKSHMNLDTIFDTEDEMQAADFFTLLDL
ncbi:heat stress transcription factor B-3-like isoform X2 [Tachysurus fulvidraco]|uniref:heat stress transcription factor B-3-like isoform X2 n=1 Tax=Tachysurus fulvidraco TaxID=1234273 RepID=UPI001FEEAFA5|nr:heat stress transcription factor B-3-like isoform X2 [Tachysurus fulvidraco]